MDPVVHGGTASAKPPTPENIPPVDPDGALSGPLTDPGRQLMPRNPSGFANDVIRSGHRIHPSTLTSASSTRRIEMHSYIHNSLEAKVAAARINESVLRNDQSGFGVTCIRSIEALRHLVTMFQHRFTQRLTPSAVRMAWQPERPCYPGGYFLQGNVVGQPGGKQPDRFPSIRPQCPQPALFGWFGKTVTAPSLVTT